MGPFKEALPLQVGRTSEVRGTARAKAIQENCKIAGLKEWAQEAAGGQTRARGHEAEPGTRMDQQMRSVVPASRLGHESPKLSPTTSPSAPHPGSPTTGPLPNWGRTGCWRQGGCKNSCLRDPYHYVCLSVYFQSSSNWNHVRRLASSGRLP